MAESMGGIGAEESVIDIVLIAAVAENGVIGRDNQLPWRLKSDLRHFRKLTMGRPVVMGRRTFQSLLKPLDGRTTIVVTRDAGFSAPGIVVAPSLQAALITARGDALRRGADAIMVIGGAEIFAQTMPIADRLEVTLVHTRPHGDTIFPPIHVNVWHEIMREDHAPGPQDEAAFSLIAYERVDRIRPAQVD